MSRAERAYPTPTGFRIRVSELRQAPNMRKYVDQALDENWITQGVFVDKFQKALAEFHGVKYAVCCNSGTSALHLALLAAGVGPGSAVVVPSLTYIATANAAVMCGARVYVADVDAETFTIDPESAEACRLAAIADGAIGIYVVPVHLYDAPANVDRLADLFGTDRVIVDSAHAVGRKDVPVDAIASTLSFFASKVVATGEGGAILTNSRGFKEMLESQRGQGVLRAGAYFHDRFGFNYRMMDLQGAMGLSAMEVLPQTLKMRRAFAESYRSLLKDDYLVSLQGGENLSAWTFPILIPDNVDRDVVMAHMDELGVETRPFFVPIYRQPFYSASCSEDRDEFFPVTEWIGSRGILLPLHEKLFLEEIPYVVDALHKAIEFSINESHPGDER